MHSILEFFNSIVFWGAWIIIPILMEIIPALGSAFLLLRRRGKGVEYKQPDFFPDVAVIVPIYNSEKTLEPCIRSLAEGSYPASRLRVFLVDNGSKDNSFQVFAKCQEEFQDLRLQWFSSEQGKSRAMNMALYNSNCEYIINIDSDGRLEKDALVHMISKFEARQDVSVMTGAILTSPEDIEAYKGFFKRLLRKLEFMEYAQAFLAGRSYASETNSVYTLSGAFSAFRKSAILQSWMYNTDTITEDTHLTFQMRYNQNQKIEICEKAIFFVDPIEGINNLYTQRQRWQRGSLEVANMFMTKDFKARKIFKDVNVRTLMYDHTFAFPRLIWYLALLCLIALHFSVKAIIYSTLIIFGLYILVGFIYYFTTIVFLRPIPDLQRYYRKHWWCVFIMPLFNFMVFFIRMAGIINSIGSDSSWRTKTLTQEWQAFKDAAKELAGKSANVYRRADRVINYEEEK